jgi:hypothetical protein
VSAPEQCEQTPRPDMAAAWYVCPCGAYLESMRELVLHYGLSRAHKLLLEAEALGLFD